MLVKIDKTPVFFSFPLQHLIRLASRKVSEELELLSQPSQNNNIIPEKDLKTDKSTKSNNNQYPQRIFHTLDLNLLGTCKKKVKITRNWKM